MSQHATRAWGGRISVQECAAATLTLVARAAEGCGAGRPEEKEHDDENDQRRVARILLRRPRATRRGARRNASARGGGLHDDNLLRLLLDDNLRLLLDGHRLRDDGLGLRHCAHGQFFSDARLLIPSHKNINPFSLLRSNTNTTAPHRIQFRHATFATEEENAHLPPASPGSLALRDGGLSPIASLGHPLQRLYSACAAPSPPVR